MEVLRKASHTTRVLNLMRHCLDTMKMDPLELDHDLHLAVRWDTVRRCTRYCGRPVAHAAGSTPKTDQSLRARMNRKTCCRTRALRMRVTPPKRRSRTGRYPRRSCLRLRCRMLSDDAAGTIVRFQTMSSMLHSAAWWSCFVCLDQHHRT